jgi:hypothetical protein
MIAFLLAIGSLIVSPQGDTKAATAAITGDVREAGSHAPIANARVVLSGAGTRESTTADSQGRFAVTGLAPGRYTLAADRENFAFEPGSAPAAILSAGSTTRVDVEMVRAAVIVGEVRDDQGNLRNGVPVTAIRKMPGGGTELPRRSPPPRTNDLGQFRVDGLLPGDYLILASPPDERARGTALMPTYYPSTTDQKAAASVAAGPGDTVPVSITMLSTPTFEVSGVVVDEQGRPQRAMIAFVSQSVQTWTPGQSAALHARVSALITRPDGTFRIAGLGPGTYRLTPMPAPEAPPQQLSMDVMTAGIDGNRSTVRVDVRDSDVSEVRIVLQRSR